MPFKKIKSLKKLGFKSDSSLDTIDYVVLGKEQITKEHITEQKDMQKIEKTESQSEKDEKDKKDGKFDSEIFALAGFAMQSQNPKVQASTNFLEQKMIEIYEKLLNIEASIDEIKKQMKKLKNYCKS